MKTKPPVPSTIWRRNNPEKQKLIQQRQDEKRKGKRTEYLKDQKRKQLELQRELTKELIANEKKAKKLVKDLTLKPRKSFAELCVEISKKMS